MFPLLKEGGEAVCLIKPQFEAGKDKVGKKGVVRDIQVHKEVVRRVTDMMIETGFSVVGLEFSPIKGPEGNIEYLAYIRKDSRKVYEAEDADNVVETSHNQL